MVLLTVLQEPSLGPLVSRAAGRPCLLQAFACWVPSAGPFSCTWRSVQFYLQCFWSCWQLPVCRQVWSPGGHRFGQHSVQGGVNWTMSSATGRLSALWFRELQGGPACYRPFRVGCRPPALSTALGDVYSSTHSASGATSNCKSADKSGPPGGHHFGQHSVQRSVSRAMCHYIYIYMNFLVWKSVNAELPPLCRE